MMAFWSSLSLREKGLIGIAAALLAALLVTFAIVRPILAFRDSGVAAFEQSSRTFRLVQQAVQSPTDADAPSGTALRSVLTNTARQSGVVVNRVAPEGQSIDLSLNNTTADKIYAWLDLLAREHDVFVQEGQIRPTGDGTTVAARFRMAKGG